MLKCKLTAAEHAALPEGVKSYYKQSGETFLLQTDEAADLISARNQEKLRADGLQIQVTGLTSQVTSLTTENQQIRSASGNVVALEASWKAKVQAVENDRDTKLGVKDKQLQKVLVSNVAQTLATEMAGDNAHLLVPVIQARLSADTTGEEAVTRILDAEGKPSASTIADLKKQLVDSGKYKAILIASQASGSAANTSTSRPAAVPKDKKFNELTEAERILWNKEDAAGFKKAADDFRATQQPIRRVV